MQMKTSIPKLHSYKLKSGIQSEGIETHPTRHNHLNEFMDALHYTTDVSGRNLSMAEIIGCIEFLKRDLMG